ncbi:MAG: type I restriction endonuclease subunit R [Brevinema sp.]
MSFNSESAFENALITLLFEKGWENKVLKYPTEQDLIQNWADILFNANRGIDQLNNVPLSDTEMQQIIEQINTLKTPLALNSFINGKTVAIRRDNPEDKLHFGKEVSLKIYDRQEIAAGQSRYQIVQQPKFPSKSPILNDRRGDIMLLINGMPVFHIELKRSGVPISQACHQIEKYSYEGIFTGLFSLVQVFVAMTPEETLYFANPGSRERFNPDYYFHWADFNNEPINRWTDIAEQFLSIPMAHQIIGFYTVADSAEGILKVMRSYQYYAAHAISDKVAKMDWQTKNQLGGYIWHTTGSGKTMTSFKSAQLIANSKDADKVVFLMDRIELGTQSLKEYRNFAEQNESVQATENSHVLITKLKSSNPADTLIVTSIQKMSNIQEEGLNKKDIELMSAKRIVIIIDECHRSTFGRMLDKIKDTFYGAIFFGFTGTPIHEENQKKNNTTTDVFGNELHRYSIVDGIRDKNVLGFDTYKVLTFKDKDLRREVALHEAKAKTEEEAIANPEKSKVYYNFINDVPMAGFKDENNNYTEGIEDFIPKSQYHSKEHQDKVVEDICNNFLVLSHGYKLHAIFATSSIREAIEYYRLFKASKPELKTTCLFDPHIDNDEGYADKEKGLVEILTDYNARYEKEYSLKNFDAFKKDLASRLAHKEPYQFIKSEGQIDLLIVVDQMLTGFDSKWVNTLYMDKMMEYQNIIQAFSRTNRLFGPEKPFGTIRYYRKPHTMEANIQAAVKLYSGDKPIGLFVPKLKDNLDKLNITFRDVSQLFGGSFDKLPEDPAERGKFALLFKELNEYLEAAKIQGFSFKELVYEFEDELKHTTTKVALDFDETQYLSLAIRYKELFKDTESGTQGDKNPDDVPFDIVGYLTEIDTGKIDFDYLNSRFDKYIRAIQSDDISKDLALNELHKSFSILTQEEQKYANIFLRDLQRGDVRVGDGHKTLQDYIYEYKGKEKSSQINRIVEAFGLDETKLRDMLDRNLTENNIDEFGRFTNLRDTVDKEKAKLYLDAKYQPNLSPFKINYKINEILRKFILTGIFEES